MNLNVNESKDLYNKVENFKKTAKGIVAGKNPRALMFEAGKIKTRVIQLKAQKQEKVVELQKLVGIISQTDENELPKDTKEKLFLHFEQIVIPTCVRSVELNNMTIEVLEELGETLEGTDKVKI